MQDDMAGRPFEADLDVSGGRVIVTFRGEFDLAAREAAAEAVAEAIATDRESIVVDLRGVSFMDSTGVNCLMKAKTMVEPLGRRIALLNGSGQPHRTLELTGLLAEFETFEDLRQLDA